MKLLLDQNISFRVVNLLANSFEEVDHVKNLKLVDASDTDMGVCPKKRLHNYNF
ncbi:MAG: DUF5615 family PIN-like protein [Mucilaginibacter sp.]|nr:DUF5615 family PIN-like protein [Mucilaginibacter sp.]